MTTSAKVESALKTRKLRHLFAGIEQNPATKGEVVLWPYGKPVYSVREAMAYARKMNVA